MPGRKASEKTRRNQIIKAAYEIAARRGLDGLTVRQVAAKAGLSSGLVLFHFKSKERLIIALLDWVLETTTVLRISPEIRRYPAPLERLLALLRQEMNRLSSEPQRIRVFFEFWAMGTRHAGVAAKMRARARPLSGSLPSHGRRGVDRRAGALSRGHSGGARCGGGQFHQGLRGPIDDRSRAVRHCGVPGRGGGPPGPVGASRPDRNRLTEEIPLP